MSTSICRSPITPRPLLEIVQTTKQSESEMTETEFIEALDGLIEKGIVPVFRDGDGELRLALTKKL